MSEREKGQEGRQGRLQDEASPGPPVHVELSYDPRVNFAMQQNDVPLVKLLRIRNLAPGALGKLRISLWTEPEVTGRVDLKIAAVRAGETYNVDSVPLTLSPQLLAGQLERQSGAIRIEVHAGARLLLNQSHPFEVLAFNEWSGVTSLPEILAAFVLPNDPAVQRVLGTVRDLLGGRTGNPSLDGYRSRDPRRVLALVNAVYDGLMALDLTYINPPASFELTGQKVRTPTRILDTRMGTCLDLSLFAAACLEQVGLNPLVVLLADHAFAGVWLDEQSFADAATDERQKIRKRAEIEMIAVFEPTGLTTRPQLSFNQSRAEAMLHLDQAYSFEFALDVASARRSGIRPLPLRASGEGEAPEAKSFHSKAPPLKLFDVLRRDPSAHEPRPAEPESRVDRWKRRLLDLTLRNRLVNFRDTRRTVPLLVPELGALEDVLVAGDGLEVCARPRLFDVTSTREIEMQRRRGAEDPRRLYLVKELAAGRIHSSLHEDEVARRLLDTFRAARLTMEESGSNTLYLALGFLSWYETPGSDVERRAPILLLPIELTRESVRAGFRIHLVEEEPRLNVTLLEKLRVDFDLDLSALERLPEDEAGIDVARILREFRKAVLVFDNWDVVEDARIGLFSFQKFLMWRDLAEREEQMRGNAVVSHLLDRPGHSFEDGGEFPDETTLDADFDPGETFCPLDADSSQLAAVHAASGGRSFVLQGPPGTGKSQTIANLVSHCLAQGQRVLFVAEKRAALEVVRRRLEGVGLGPFCLALHSNKTRKKDVHEQLRAALDVAVEPEEPDWQGEAEALGRTRRQLNEYCESLHSLRPLGHSAFDGLASLIGLRKEEVVTLNLGRPEDMQPATLADLRDRIEVLRAEVEAVRGVGGHPLLPVGLEHWEPRIVDESRKQAHALARAVDHVRKEATPVATAMGIAKRSWSRIDLAHMSRWQTLFASSPGATRQLVSIRDFKSRRQDLQEWIEKGRRRDVLRADLFDRYSDGVLGLDHSALVSRLRRATESPFLLRWFVALPARRAVSKHVRKGKVSPTDRLITELELAADVGARNADLTATDSEAAKIFAQHWNGGEAHWTRLEGMLEWVGVLQELLVDVAGMNFEESERLRSHWTALATQATPVAATTDLDAFESALSQCADARRELAVLLKLDEDRAWGHSEAGGALGHMESMAERIVQHGGELRGWTGYAQARREAVEVGLFPVVDALESAKIGPDRLAGTFERSFQEWWTGSLFATDDVLGEFSSTRHGRTVEKFRQLDRRLTGLTSRVVHHRLASRVPRGGGEDAKGSQSEMGILHRELQKRSRHKPLRRLLGEIPNVLARVKPCMLMSPLAVAQYLGPDFPQFDVVVFDEASQIPVWDAVGAMARGERVIVVGDSRQLPPTSFFMKDEAGDLFDEDEVEDLESVLDECVAARLPSRTLRWHYRSRHESLIAFSNHHYYDGKLMTFPNAAAAAGNLGVRLRMVPDGVYDKGRTRTNRREAQALVDEVVQRLWDPYEANRSIGIVTFNRPQQTLIEDLLEERRIEYPEIDVHFTSAVDEPVFVKNLENVQGDERDVILFSIGYGPDETGRVVMNFGPLNRDGGERRLNVAITRAREQVLVFSSMRAEGIDLARTRAAGVAHLRTFLDYAERGPAAIAEAASTDTQPDRSTAFERDVQFALEEKGYRVQSQVGCSGYRVDIAIEHPGQPGNFVLGVVCDGAMYRSAKTARERERLRDEVLQRLGWQLHRVWSTDWWYEPERELERVVAAVDAALALDATRPVSTQEVRLGTPPTVNAPPPAGPETPAASPQPVAQTPEPTPPPDRAETVRETRRSTPLIAELTGEVSSQTFGPLAERRLPTRDVVQEYAPVIPEVAAGDVEGLYDTANAARILDQMNTVVWVEAPITVDLLLRRVSHFWGSPRMTRRVVERLQHLLPSSAAVIMRMDGQYVAWRSDQDPDTYREFRTSPDDAVRSADQIPVLEVSNAALYVLAAHVSLDRESLARETAKVFGISRLGTRVRVAMENGIARMQARGDCVTEGDAIRLPH